MRVCNSIQQLQNSREAGNTVQILNDAIEGRKVKITTVADQWDQRFDGVVNFRTRLTGAGPRRQRYFITHLAGDRRLGDQPEALSRNVSSFLPKCSNQIKWAFS